MRLLVTRPQPEAERQAGKLAKLGHEAIVEPLLNIEFLNPRPLLVTGAQALIVTSRNALRALTRHDDFRTALNIPLFAVGKATSRLAEKLGFATVHEGGGTAEELMPLIASLCVPEDGPLVHLAGERLAWDLKGALEREGFSVLQPVLYRAVPIERFGAQVQEALASGDLQGVILMSPATAKTFARLIDIHGHAQAAEKLACFCLSKNVAAGLESLDGARISIADAPSEDHLLALIGREAANC